MASIDRGAVGLGVLASALVLGVAASQIETWALELRVNNTYYVVSWGLGPAVFVSIVLLGATWLAFRGGDRSALILLAPVCWLGYVVAKIASWLYLSSLFHPSRLPGRSYRLIIPSEDAWLMAGPVLGILCAVLGMAILARYVARGPSREGKHNAG